MARAGRTSLCQWVCSLEMGTRLVVSMEMMSRPCRVIRANQPTVPITDSMSTSLAALTVTMCRPHRHRPGPGFPNEPAGGSPDKKSNLQIRHFENRGDALSLLNALLAFIDETTSHLLSANRVVTFPSR